MEQSSDFPASLQKTSGRSSAWLERLLWEQEVARSNRVAPIPIQEKPFDPKVERLFCFMSRITPLAAVAPSPQTATHTSPKRRLLKLRVSDPEG